MVTPAHPQRRSLSPGDKLGKHEVIRQIAAGGMAELYLTRTTGTEGLEQLVCVKRILPQHAHHPRFVQLFLSEARLAAMLHHPNIAQVYDIGQELGEHFFSMEYVHGEDLGRLVASGRDNGVQVSLDCALTIAAGLCAGLHHAHDQAAPDGTPLGLVHRDVSPANVLVSYDGAVKLVDFGIARAADEPSTSKDALQGKLAYMSPEQGRGRSALDRRSDVFSIGTILYELTTGQLPFVAATEYGVLDHIVNGDAAPPTTLVPSYPPALEAIVMRALARDPDRRYATALELRTQLERFARDNRLRISPLVLARLMSTLFPARLEEWDHARAQGAFFVEQHVVRTLVESGKTADKAARYTPVTVPIVEAGSAGVEPGTAPTSTNVDPSERMLIHSEPTMVTPPSAPPPSLALTRASSPITPATRASSPSMPATRPSSPSMPATRPSSPSMATAARASSPSMAGSTRASSPNLVPRGLPQTFPALPQSVLLPTRTTPPAMHAQPRTTPQTMPAQRNTPQTMHAQHAAARPGLPPVTNPSATAGGRGATRAAPVPNMPGAVPIVRSLPTPPVPMGGTLVTSGTQAGPPPPMVLPLRPPSFLPAGSGDFGAYSTDRGAASYPDAAGNRPGAFAGAPANVTAGDGLTGRRRGPAMLPDFEPGASDDDFGRETAHHTVADLNERVRSASARKTEQIRSQSPSQRPLIVIVMIGTLAAAGGVWFALRTTPPAPASRAPIKASAGSGALEQAPAKASAAVTPPAPAHSVWAPAAAPATELAAPPTGLAAPAATTAAPAAAATTTAAPAATTAAPATANAAPPAAGDAPARAEPTKKKASKPVRPARVRGEPKRNVRGRRAEPKEEPWNNDSPFLPEPTPKR